MAKDRKQAVAPREVSEGKRKAVAIWTKAWGLIGAVIGGNSIAGWRNGGCAPARTPRCSTLPLRRR